MPELKIYRIDNFAGGLNLKNDPAVALGGINPSQCIKAVNCDFRDKVSIQSRDSFKKTYPDAYEYAITDIFCWARGVQHHIMVKVWDGQNYLIYDGVKNIYSESSGENTLFAAVYNNHMFFCDRKNENKKYDGETVTKMGITAPATAATVAEGSVGNPSGVYYYYYSYYNADTGQESGFSPVAEIDVTDKKVGFTPVLSSDPQITHIRIYRAGGLAGPTVDGTPVKRRLEIGLNDGDGELAVKDVSAPITTDLITNGTFASDSWWAKIGQAEIADGVGKVTGSSATSLGAGIIKRDYLLTVDTKYQLKFTVPALTYYKNTAYVLVKMRDPSGEEQIVKITETGTYTYNFIATYEGLEFTLAAGRDNTTSIDDVSVTVTTSSYTDDIADGSISTTAENCSTNLVCPAINMLSVHHHEMFGAGNPDNPGWLYMSRFRNTTGNSNLEAFPASSFVKDVGNKSDPIVAILPFEIDMIIYTEHKMYRFRYIGELETKNILEEIADIGCASGKTLAEGVLENGMPCHVFLGQSSRGRGIYLFDGRSVFCISNIVEPIFSGEREDVSSINWNYVTNCCGAMHDNKYHFCYPEGAATWPGKVLIVDFETMPPRFVQADYSAHAIHTDLIANKMYFGNDTKYLYEFSGAHGFENSVEIDWQSPYFGDRSTFSQAKSITLCANTRGEDLTVKTWVDYTIEDSQVVSSDYMRRLEIDCPYKCKGRMFSVELICSSNKRVTIAPPLELKVIPLNKY